jgi:AraC-like DNA-binding protein
LLIAGVVFTEISERPVIARFLSDLFTIGSSIVPDYRGTTLWHFYIWTRIVFMIVIALELLVGVVYLLRFVIRDKVSFKHLWRFFFNGESIKVTELQIYNLLIIAIYIAAKLIFIKGFLDTHVWFSVLLAFLVSFGYSSLMFCSLFGEKESITLVQAKHVMFYNYNPAIKGPVVEIMMEELLEDSDSDMLVRFRDKVGDILHEESLTPKEITAVKEQMLRGAGVAGMWDDSLMTRFQSLMLNEQLFLQPSLSLADVAERLHTNKTYVSKMVNNTYNLGFPELLNTLRIDYAQQYLLSHKDARQDDIAKACGFLSASSFNNIFKKITGVTPKVWLVSRETKRK